MDEHVCVLHLHGTCLIGEHLEPRRDLKESLVPWHMLRDNLLNMFRGARWSLGTLLLFQLFRVPFVSKIFNKSLLYDDGLDRSSKRGRFRKFELTLNYWLLNWNWRDKFWGFYLGSVDLGNHLFLLLFLLLLLLWLFGLDQRCNWSNKCSLLFL